MATQEGIRVTFTGDASSLDNASKKAVNSLGKVSGAAGKSSQAMINFGRVLQDAPYGIQGVANNIDPLIQSLGGSAGLSIVVSAVTSALVLFGDELFDIGGKASATRKTLKEFTQVFGGDAFNNIDGARKKLEEYKQTIDGVVSKNAEELTQVTILVDRLRESNLKRGESIAIIKKLQDIAPDYFGKLNAEKASVEAVTKAYNLYNNEIIRTVETQIRIAELGKLIQERLDLTRQQKDAAAFVDDLLAQGKTLEEIGQEVAKQRENESKTIQRAALANDANLSALERQIILNSKIPPGVELIIAARKREKKILDEINAAGQKTTGIKIEPPKEAEIPELKLKVARVGLTISEFGVEKSSLNNRFDISGLIDTNKLPAPSLPAIQLPEPDPEQINRIQIILKDLQGFFEEVGEAITVSMGNAFSGLFESIMSGSQTAFQAFGVALGNIIKKLLATAAAAAVLTFILGPLGLVKGSSGQALKGFDLFRNLFGKIGGFAEGGVVQGPQSGYPAILHGKEVVAPFDKFVSLMQGAQNNGDGRLTLEVRGDKLLFAVNRAQRGRNLIG